MKTYLVGGYVRDKLLGLNPKDRDWLVVGATGEDLLKKGYHLIGKDFPVFLHPQTKEEYALARTSKTDRQGKGEQQLYADSKVTLEEDLSRRDLTINAMAMTEQGTLIDPFGGAADLKNKTLRHVSESFAEDSIRILRTARFAARYQFTLAAETRSLAQSLVAQGALDSLIPERVWAELAKALSEARPDLFLSALKEMNALKVIFPEIERLFGVPQPEFYHPEIDTGAHVLLALKKAAKLTPDKLVRFGVFVHDLGKGITPKDILPRHIGHEKAGVKLVDELCRRYRIPKRYHQFGRLCSEYHLHTHKAYELRAKTWLGVFDKMSVFKRPEDLERFLLVCQSDAQGRKGFENKAYPQTDYVREIFKAAYAVSTEKIKQQGIKGKEFGEKLRQLRILAIKEKIKSLKT